MHYTPVFLWSDILIYLLLLGCIVFVWRARRHQHVKAAWQRVFKSKIAVVAFVILSVYIAIGFLDSVHFRAQFNSTSQQSTTNYSTQVHSLLDVALAPISYQQEKTYSKPFALHLYAKESVRLPNTKTVRIYPKLQYAGQDLKRLQRSQAQDILIRSLQGLSKALAIWLLFCIIFIALYAWRCKISYKKALSAFIKNQTQIPWRLFLTSIGVVFILIGISLSLSYEYHIFGTDKIGQDVFYQAIKSIRTGLMIGTLTTLVMLPFALLLGTMAGYFRGIIDDVIQYIYTTLSSIPGVLLIAATILSLQVYIANHPELFATMAERADIRLLALCLILGIMSWTGLCRVLRGETLKLREIDYIQAAQALGVSHFKIIRRHLLPNVMHLVLIAVVLDFSTLVLAEAVLTYVGVGVDPTTLSWGNMINSARLELAREPIVWWPLLAAFILMFILVLAANLFADAVRDAFDPRIRQSM